MAFPCKVIVMRKPVPDKAEVVLGHPDKLYLGPFEGPALFDAHFDDSGASLLLDDPGDTSKSLRVHIHHELLADILGDLAKTASGIAADHSVRRKLADGAKALHEALAAPLTDTDPAEAGRQLPVDDIARMSPEEEVLLLHVLE